MEEAYQVHRTKLFNAFSRECNQFERDLRQELVKRDAIFSKEKECLLEEIRSLRSQEFRADDLRRESRNIELDHEATRRSSRRSPPHHLSQREAQHQPTPGANGIDMPIELESDQASKLHAELVTKFDDLSRQYSMLVDAHHTLLAKYKREKETIRVWAGYIEKLRQRRRSRPTTSAGPSDDELAPSVFPTGASTSDMQTPCGGAPSSIPSKIPPPSSLKPAVRLPSGGRNGCSTDPNPNLSIEASVPNSPIESTARVGVLGRSPDSSGKTSIKHEYSSMGTFLEFPRHHTDGSPGCALPTPDGSNRQRRVRAKIQCLNKTHLDGFDSAETTDGEIERRNAVSSPSMTVAKADHRGPKYVPEEHASSPGMPIVLSERCLKHKMTTHYGSVTKPIRVKSEHGSSSPIGLAGFRDYYEARESLDLDEVGEKVDTPRKRKKLRHISLDSNFLLGNAGPNPLKYPIQSSVEISGKDKGDCSDPGAGEESLHHLGESEEGGDSMRRIEGISHKGEIMSWATSGLNGNDAFQRHLTSLKPEGSPHASVLQPGSTNLRLSRITRDSKPKNSRSRPGEDLEKTIANIHHLAEDGEYVLRGAPEESTLATTETIGEDVGPTPDKRDSRHKRLAALLDARSPGKSALYPGKRLSRNNKHNARSALPCDGQSHKDATFQEDSELSLRQPHIVALERNRIQSPAKETKARTREERKPRTGGLADPNHRRLGNSGSRRKQGSEPPDLDTTPDCGRLRDRPVHSLTLDDFKVNPNYIKGSGFAFAETVRNPDQRKCLPGCTKPACCGGTFRKALELGGILASTPLRTKLFWNSSQEQEDEEQKLLEDYVGDDRGLLDKLSPEARHELVIQARTKQFADKHGRHRQAFERRTTPPGFWRTDMPTTQELEQDRGEAKMMERRMVEERYRETRRGKGKWKFRDE